MCRASPTRISSRLSSPPWVSGSPSGCRSCCSTPRRSERMPGLARFVIELEGNAWHPAAEQWLERTLDDSANRRLVIPEAFLASDAILVLATNVAAGLEVREPVIARHVAAQLPFLATERLLMRGVKAGGDRQRLHEVIRTHSLAVAQAVAEGGVADDPA